jgi:ABC-type tungstate transport system substrate-binding protein
LSGTSLPDYCAPHCLAIISWERPMEAFSLLFTTDYGLMSLAVILFTIVIGFYMSRKLKKLMNQEPGKEGWD